MFSFNIWIFWDFVFHVFIQGMTCILEFMIQLEIMMTHQRVLDILMKPVSYQYYFILVVIGFLFTF